MGAKGLTLINKIRLIPFNVASVVFFCLAKQIVLCFYVRILSCLMEHMHTDVMNPECEQQLLHLEFFISRDFR